MPMHKRIVIMDEDSIVFLMPRDVRAFKHSYIHSVSKTSVVEHYIVKGNRMYLDTILYQSQGAGLPEVESNLGEFSSTEKGFRMDYVALEMGSINLVVQDKYKNTLYYDTKKLELDQTVFIEQRAYIKLMQLTLLESWIYRSLNK
jgi:hypothetical protein